MKGYEKMKYTVKKGDTLSAIAKANNTTVSDLAKINNISNPNLIYAGATIEIPDASGAPSASAPAANTNQTVSQSAPGTASKTDPYYGSKPTYKESSDVTSARSDLKSHEASAPDEYKSAYADRIEAALTDIMNREDFSYDPTADPVYGHYRDRYIRDGERAMRDTVGNAAGLTGGYGNSYAVTAGQGAYNTHLEKLQDVIPALMDAAYKSYEGKLEGKRADLETLLGLDEEGYSRYRDTVSDYNDRLDYLYKKLSDMSDADYNRFLGELSQWNTDRDYGRKVYEDERDAAYQRERDAVSDSQWEREQALASAKLAASSSETSSSKSSKDKVTTVDETKKEDKEFNYYDCGAEARRIIKILSNEDIFDAGGHLKLKYIELLREAKTNKKITTDEYNYIYNMAR